MDLVWIWLLGAIWGGVFLLMKLAVATLPPLTAALGRISIAAVALLAIVALRPSDRAALREHAPPLLIMGLLNNALPQALMAWSLGRIDSGLAAILNATMPFFTVALAWALRSGTRPTLAQGAGVALGLLGVFVLVGPEAVRGVGDSVLGELAMLGVAFSYACAAVYGAHLKVDSPLVASAGQLMGAAFCLLPAWVIFEPPVATHPSALSLGALASAGLVGTAVAYLLYFRILARSGPTRLSLVTYVSPLFAVGWGWLVLNERLTWNAAAAFLMIATGILCVNGLARHGGARLKNSLTQRGRSRIAQPAGGPPRATGEG